MDQESQKMLDQILAKEPAALTDEDKAFLRARSSYLNEEQNAVYAEVLAEGQEINSEQSSEPEPEVDPESEQQTDQGEETTAEQPAKRGRKPKSE